MCSTNEAAVRPFSLWKDAEEEEKEKKQAYGDFKTT